MQTDDELEKPINLSRQLYLLVITYIGADKVKSLRKCLACEVYL